MMLSKKGFSLFEMLITIAILMTLGGALIWMILSSKTSLEMSRARTYLRQEMQTVVVRISNDLQKSKLKLVTPGTNAFSFPSAEDVNGKFITDTSGMPVWQKYVIYYIPNNTTKLIRREVTGITSRIPEANLPSYCNGQGKVISLMVSNIKTQFDSRHVDLAITVQSKNNLGNLDMINFNIDIYPLNNK